MGVFMFDPTIDFISVQIGNQEDYRGRDREDDHLVIFLVTEFRSLNG